MKITKRTTMRSRRAISEIIAIILVVGLTIVAAGILYTYFSTTATRASNTAQFQVSADLKAPTGNSPGILAVSLVNSGSVAIQGISASFSGNLVGSGTGACTATFTSFNYNNNPVSSSNPIPPGSGTSASCNTGAVVAGTAYSFTLTVTFANGQSQTQAVSVTAH